MKLCVLFSGGKDSTMALYRGMEEHKIEVLLSMLPGSSDSYMYHVPNIQLTKYSAEAMDLPIVLKETIGKPPQENVDLRDALEEIKKEYLIEGVAAGAIGSNYQYNIVSNICKDLGLETFTPYWQKDHEMLIRDAIDAGFDMRIVGVAAAGLDSSWLGRRLDSEALEELKKIRMKHRIDIGGEGGEYETFVVDGPVFKKRLEILKARKVWDGVRGELIIDDLRLVEK
jgi:ABC transporter with metal-binding/Fe-S-binding domain ATP-binding protein